MAAVGSREAREDADQRGFACAVRPEQCKKFTLLNTKGDVVERANVGVGFANVVDVDGSGFG